MWSQTNLITICITKSLTWITFKCSVFVLCVLIYVTTVPDEAGCVCGNSSVATPTSNKLWTTNNVFNKQTVIIITFLHIHRYAFI